MEFDVKPIQINGFTYIKPIKMMGKRLGCIQPVCSKPGHSWQGFLFFSKVGPFSWEGICCIKKSRPRGLRLHDTLGKQTQK